MMRMKTMTTPKILDWLQKVRILTSFAFFFSVSAEKVSDVK